MIDGIDVDGVIFISLREIKFDCYEGYVHILDKYDFCSMLDHAIKQMRTWS